MSEAATGVGALLKELTNVLAVAGIERPADESRDIVAALCDQPRFWPTLNRDYELPAKLANDARTAAGRRAQGMPFAYAVGRAAFRHLTLDVDPRVLIPRQETEYVVEIILLELGDSSGIAVDVGTGSGAIALALATESGLSKVIATDISKDAIAVARANAEKLATQLKAKVEFREGNGLAPVIEQVDAVVSNPPYIAFEEAEELPASVRDWEPSLALISADHGLRTTAEIVRDATRVLKPGGLLALEIDSRRGEATAATVHAVDGYKDIVVRPDLAGRDRILTARWMG